VCIEECFVQSRASHPCVHTKAGSLLYYYYYYYYSYYYYYYYYYLYHYYYTVRDVSICRCSSSIGVGVVGYEQL